MATLVSYQDGNLTGATTWKLASSAINLTTTATAFSVNSTTYQYSTAFSIANGEVIEGLALCLNRNSSTPTTFFVALSDDNGVTATREVTVNLSNLDNYTGGSGGSAGAFTPYWVFFKFATPLTSDGGSDYKIGVKLGASSSLVVSGSSANNPAYILRRDTTATATAGDSTFVFGELTGLDTGNDITVTMDSTTNTDYGAMTIGKRGTLSYGTSASTNYHLKLSGNLDVRYGGTLNIGTVATPIPRDSTAKLEFDCTTTGEFGLRCYAGTVISQGLSRTSGKNVVRCRLTADTPTVSPTNVTATNNGTVGYQMSNTSNSYDPTSTSFYSGNFTDNTTNGVHYTYNSPSMSYTTNSTKTFQVWLARGSGTNNRYVRVQLCSSPGGTNGFYADVDLQDGTIGTCTAIGNGTATSSSIAAYKSGYLCTISGIISSSASSMYTVLYSMSALDTTTYVGDTTQCFIFFGGSIWDGLSVGSSTLSVNTDTGWLADDIVVITGTQRATNESEIRGLSGNAGASSMTLGQPLSSTHDGNTPTNAEVLLLTRNVKICGSSPNNTAHILFDTASTVDFDWTEMYWLANGTSSGININASSANFNYCSRHSSVSGTGNNQYGWLISIANNVTISNSTAFWIYNVIVNQSNNATTGLTLDSNSFTRTVGSANIVTCFGKSATITNNCFSGSASIGFSISSSINAITTFSNNEVYCSSTGLSIGNFSAALLSNFKCWRNTTSGLSVSSSLTDTVIDSAEIFGNTTYNVLCTSCTDLTFTNCTIAGESGFASVNGFAANSAPSRSEYRVINCNIGVASGIYTNHTNDINMASSSDALLDITLINTNLGSTTEVNGSGTPLPNSVVRSQRHDGTAGNHIAWKVAGRAQTDTVIYRNGSPSERLTPSSASIKLASATKKVAVANGGTATVSVYVRESVVGDGTDYNGARARLILKANHAAGITADTVIDTATVSSEGAWELLSGASTPAVTDNAVLEFYVDCDGTTGWINVDDWSVS